MTKPHEYYIFTNGWTMRREGDNYRWHLRKASGHLVDTDRYRHDLISRHDLDDKIQEHFDPCYEEMQKRRRA